MTAGALHPALAASAQEVAAGESPRGMATPPTRGIDPMPPEAFLRAAEEMVDRVVANSR